MPAIVRTSGSRPWYTTKPTSSPSTNEPERFTTTVPHGKRRGLDPGCTPGRERVPARLRAVRSAPAHHTRRPALTTARSSCRHRQSSSAGSNTIGAYSRSVARIPSTPTGHRDDAGNQAGDDVERRARAVTVACEQHRLHHPGGEGGEAAAHADCEERARAPFARAGSLSTPSTRPSSNAPTTLTPNVVHGKRPLRHRLGEGELVAHERARARRRSRPPRRRWGGAPARGAGSGWARAEATRRAPR